MTEERAGLPYVVLWHPDAEVERDAADPKGEIVAILNAAEKLQALGSSLGFPHSSAVQGRDAEGLRELRPRRGRSRWRPLYIQANASTFVILAVAPEAQIDKRGFDAAVRSAVSRRSELEDG